ncbi:filamentous hemagglutinin N-terminal domain-containing protein, partial [Caviibacterium pharyngocola]
MNKKCFRVIFSKTLQRLIVTSELAKSAGKSTDARSDNNTIHTSTLTLKPLVFSLFCAFGWVLFPDFALAETLIIQADGNAPKSQQPIILNSANNVPQINIQTPNAQGLSHNKYAKFDVDTKGAVLNNSRTNVQTQQAGWIQGNPYLARGEAKVILNEVNSSDPSVLKGYVEVAGKKADVIIANPSGIHCDGCGVINSDRNTLTTGKPQIQQGHLEGFVVEKGRVSVAGKGLDNSRVDYTEILAKEMHANAGVWAKKELNVITGNNQVKRHASGVNIVRSTQGKNNGDHGRVAVDVGELGGMYANKIHLIGTENGLGVRNSGHIGASSDSLTIDSQGRIINQGVLNAKQSVSLTARQDIENTGKIENRENDIILRSQNSIKQKGSIVAREGNIRQTAAKAITQSGETVARQHIDYQAETLDFSPTSLLAAGVKITENAGKENRSLDASTAQGKQIRLNATGRAVLQGKQFAPGQVNVNAAAVSTLSQTEGYDVNIRAKQGSIDLNKATISAKNNLEFVTPITFSASDSTLLANSRAPAHLKVTAASVAVSGSQMQAFDIRVDAKQGDISLNNSTLDAQNHLSLATPETLSTTRSALFGKRIETLQQTLKTNNALWQQKGTQDFNLNARHIDNQGGTFYTQGDFYIRTQSMNNPQGRLLTDKNLFVHTTTGDFLSQNGTLSAVENITLFTGKLDNRAGLIQAGGNLTVNTAGRDIINDNTAEKGLIALGALHVQSGNISNAQGKIAAKDDLTFNATDIKNQAGLLQTESALNLKATALTNDQGIIKANGNTNLQLRDAFSQQGGQLNTAQLSVNAGSWQSTANSKVSAQQATFTVHGNFSNADSQIDTAGDLQLSSQNFSNRNGAINSQGEILLDTATQNLDNEKGAINAKVRSEIRSGALNNAQGVIYSGADMLIDTHQQRLTNTDTAANKGIIAQGKLTLDSGDIDNQNGRIASLDVLHITVKQADNTDGRIQSTQSSLTLQADQVTNHNGVIFAEKQGNITVAQAFNQTTGKLGADNLTISAGALSSLQNSFITAQQLALFVQGNVENRQSEISATNNLIVQSGALDNQGGLLLSKNGEINIDTRQQVFNNQAGVVSAEGALSLQIGALDNHKGLIQTRQALNLNTHAQSLDNRDGTIFSSATAQILSGELDNHKGIIQTEDALHINTSGNELTNLDGKIFSGAALTLQSGDLNNSRGTLSAATLHLTTSAFNQQQGVVQAQGDITLNATSITSSEQSLLRGERVNLTAQQGLTNTDSVIFAEKTTALSAQGIDNRRGEITALTDQLTLRAGTQKLDNRQGTIGGQRVSILSGELDNTQGAIRSLGELTINTQQGNLINNQTQTTDVSALRGIVSNGKLTLTTRQLFNENGAINSGGAQHINGQSLNNQRGVISGTETLRINLTQAIDNQGGRISAKGIAIEAAAVDNQAQGRILSNASATLTLRQGLSNQFGTIKAGENLRVRAENIDNQNGILSAVGGELDAVAKNTLNNPQGNITAAQAVHLSAPSMNNQGGEIVSTKSSVSLTAGTTAFDNRQGNVFAGGALRFQGADVLNGQGSFFAHGKLDILSGQGDIDNRQGGQIQSLGAMTLQAQRVQNQGGVLQTADNLTLRAATLLNQKVSETGSLIEAGETLHLHTTDIDNRNTLGTAVQPSQGIIAKNINLHAKQLDNRQGGIYALNNALFTVAQHLNNRQGELLSLKDLHIDGYDSDLQLDNAQGKIQSRGRLAIGVGALTAQGQLDGEEIDLRVKADIITQGDINAKQRLHIHTLGKLENSHRLAANQTVSLQATQIQNTQSGEISSAQTQLNSSQVENRGLINSFSDNGQSLTLIRAESIDNLGSGRLYGDHIALQAERLTNRDEKIDEKISSATIAARQRLDMAVKEVINHTTEYDAEKKGGSLIYSNGDIVFG